MTAMQFDTEIHEGVLSLPTDARKAFEGRVRVILMKEDAEVGDDFIRELIAAPADVPGFTPLSRDEANERGRGRSSRDWLILYTSP